MPEESAVVKRVSSWREKMRMRTSGKAQPKKSAVVMMEVSSRSTGTGDAAGESAAGSAIPLAAMRPGEAGVVVDLRSGAHSQVQKCLALGILPGAAITVRRRSPSFIFDIGFSQFAVDEEMANVVLVQPNHRR
jgi:ferrous iron transport protein A